MNCAHSCINATQVEMAAWTALDDLREVQQAFDNAHAVFAMIIDKTYGLHIAKDLAVLGIADLTEWSSKLDRYADQLESTLSATVDANPLTSTTPRA
ncbi:hypothetical protein PAGU2196_34080 [Pseudomonas sp. PAGU 2196]|uniref:hypothetical protein n=1 Tax=Pseudomonas sp. PAGU 2196 TaxID=2793997 RepID=UPI001EDF4F03|nr:hypothetical protein [Pseudomonas sp. PAGU 2196]GHS82574.1 hypothetical protein PAGU2196_34080 [Pseudomonas sp. PAGU 2196]